MSNDGNGPDLTIDSLLAEGERAFSEGRVDDARELFERILAVDGAQATALNNLAVLCHQSGDLGQAETLFLRAAVLQSDPADVLINLSAVAQHDQRLPEAAAYLERALELRGETPRILEQMANMAEVMGDPITGKQLWRKALSQAVQPESAWLAAFHEVDITPSLDAEIHLQGFFGPARAAQSVSSPLKMQLLLLEDGYRHRTLIVSADLFGFGPEMVELIRSIAGVWGVSPAAVILNASHTHYAPGTVSHAVPGLGRLEPEFAEAVCHAITAAMPTLYLSLQPSALSWGRASCQIGFNRRKVVGTSVEMAPNTDGFYDTETPLLLVSREDGQRCLLVNHGCHPTGLGNSNQISADFPGALRDEVVRVGSADVVMFLQGAAGNLKQGALAGERAGWI